MISNNNNNNNNKNGASGSSSSSDGFTTVQVRRWNPKTKTYGRWKYVCKNKHNLLLTEGRDWIHAQVYVNVAAGTRGSNFIALTETNITPAAGDTTLSGEITTNGLQRVQSSGITHTDNSNTTTYQHTFTASGAFTTVRASGLFTASSGGIMSHENTFTSVALSTSDQLIVTWTLQLG